MIEGNGKPPLEFHLHVGIYRARPDVKAVVHAHPKWSTFLTMVGQSYQPVYAQGSLVYPMPVLDSPNSINNPAMAKRLADTLGDRPAAMMKSHGAVTVGKDIVEAFVLANYLEENAYRQYMALQIGKPYSFSAEEVAAVPREALDREPVQAHLGPFPRQARLRREVGSTGYAVRCCHRSGRDAALHQRAQFGRDLGLDTEPAFHAGRPWCRSMPRPLMVRLPRARAAARNGVSSGM